MTSTVPFDSSPLPPDPQRPVSALQPRVLRDFARTATNLLGAQSRTMSPRAALTRLCERCIDATDANGAVVLLVDPDGTTLRPLAGAGVFADPQDLTSPTIGPAADWLAASFEHREVIMIEDIARWPAESEQKAWAMQHQVRSCWVTPIVSIDAEVLGVFSVCWPTAGIPAADTRWLLEEHGILAQAVIDRQHSHWRRMALIAQERSRIAGELHDDSVQAMTAVSLRLQQVGARLAGTEEAELVGDLRSQVDDAIERLRHMLFSLASPTLEDEGLVVTLEIYLETYIEPTGLKWELRADPSLRCSDDVEALAFRLARGAIINVLKHAQASNLTVDLTLVDDDLEVRITDDGKGFDPTPSSIRQPGHIGLSYAHALASAVGGTYLIESAPGAGTTVTFRIPQI